MTTTCQNCQSPFTVPQEDLAYYDKAAPIVAGQPQVLPPPTHCPDCRQQRRFAWRNERHLYHRKCDATGKTIVTNIHPDTDLVVYDQQEWWGDGWDALSYGRDFDFSRPFFEQFADMQREVPQLALHVWNCENCDFCNYAGSDKSCYLIFGSVYSEDCYYGSPYYSKDCIDTLVVRECEKSYECVDCRKLHTSFYCQDCHSSNDLIYCYDLQGCSECIGCAGLRNKSHCIFNEQLSKEDYFAKKKELDLCIPAVHDLLKKKLAEMSLQIPHRYMQSNKVENVSGNYVYECKNVHDSFYADRSEDCKYCAQVVDLKDCHDNNYTEENELCYEYFGGYINNRMHFSKLCQSNDSLYCDACHSSKFLFGCIGVRNKEYCILNKQYSKEEYEELVPKIIDHMRKTPLRSPSGSSAGQEWGEFFPVEISPFGYNETVAQEYFQMTQEQVEQKGWFWRADAEKEGAYMGPPANLPDRIEEIPDDICEKILQCTETKKLYKIIPQELAFYRELKLPAPKLCPNQRHRRRLDLRNPRKLWTRNCSDCGKEIRTSYSPERPERVVCESCYLSAVY